MFGTIRNLENEKLDYSYHAAAEDHHVVILGHGVTGNKDRPFITALAEGLVEAGIPALRVSFAGNGKSEGKFEGATISKEVEDLCCVIDAVTYVGKGVSYVGHSMGAAVGVIRASKDNRIQRLVSLAGMVHTKAFCEREFGDVLPGKGCMWDEPDFPLSQDYVDDCVLIRSVITKGGHIEIPWLFVHGTEDDVVPIQDSLDIFERANEPKSLVKLDGGDHVFTDNADAMVKTVVRWLQDTPV